MHAIDFERIISEVLTPYLRTAPAMLHKKEELLFGNPLDRQYFAWYAISLAKLQRYQGPTFGDSHKDALYPIVLELVSVVFTLATQGIAFPEGSLAHAIYHFKGQLPGLILKYDTTLSQRERRALVVEQGQVKLHTYKDAIALIAHQPSATLELGEVSAEGSSMHDILQMYKNHNLSL